MASKSFTEKLTNLEQKTLKPELPVTCKCRKQCNNCKIFLGFFVLSLWLHLVTLFFYWDLRSEVKRELLHKNREEFVTPDAHDFKEQESPEVELSDLHYSALLEDDEVNTLSVWSLGTEY